MSLWLSQPTRSLPFLTATLTATNITLLTLSFSPAETQSISAGGHGQTSLTCSGRMSEKWALNTSKLRPRYGVHAAHLAAAAAERRMKRQKSASDEQSAPAVSSHNTSGMRCWTKRGLAIPGWICSLSSNKRREIPADAAGGHGSAGFCVR